MILDFIAFLESHVARFLIVYSSMCKLGVTKQIAIRTPAKKWRIELKFCVCPSPQPAPLQADIVLSPPKKGTDG